MYNEHLELKYFIFWVCVSMAFIGDEVLLCAGTATVDYRHTGKDSYCCQ